MFTSSVTSFWYCVSCVSCILVHLHNGVISLPEMFVYYNTLSFLCIAQYIHKCLQKSLIFLQ